MIINKTQRIVIVAVLVFSGGLMTGCPFGRGTQPPTTKDTVDMYVINTAPAGYEVHTLMAYTTQHPGGVNQTAALRMTQGNVLKLADLKKGESYYMELTVTRPSGGPATLVGNWGVLDSDVFWTVWEDKNGNIQHVRASVTANCTYTP